MDSDPPSLGSFRRRLGYDGQAGAAEAALLARCRRGEPDAWDELFDLHYAAAGRFIFQLSHRFHPGRCGGNLSGSLSVRHQKPRFVPGRKPAFKPGCFASPRTRRAIIAKSGTPPNAAAARRTISLQAEDPETGLTLDPPADAPGPDELLMNAERTALVRESLDHSASLAARSSNCVISAT